MKTSKLMALVAGSTVALGIGAAGMSYTYAQNAVANETFSSVLSSKLGVPEEKVSSALSETRLQMHTERTAEVNELVDQALKDGKLTQRQVEIISTMHEIREEKFDSDEPRRGGMRHEEMLSDLNEKGLNVTEEELTTLREEMRELGIGGKGNGMGKGMHREI